MTTAEHLHLSIPENISYHALGHIPLESVFEPMVRQDLVNWLITDGPQPFSAVIRWGQRRYYARPEPVMAKPDPLDRLGGGDFITSPEGYEYVGQHIVSDYWIPALQATSEPIHVLTFGDGTGAFIEQSLFTLPASLRKKIDLTIIDPQPHLLNIQYDRIQRYLSPPQIHPFAISIEDYFSQNNKSDFTIIQSNEVLDELDFVALRKDHGTIEELFLEVKEDPETRKDVLLFTWRAPDQSHREFTQQFASYITPRPAIYQPDAVWIMQESIQRLQPKGIVIALDYFQRGPTPLDNIHNLSLDIETRIDPQTLTPYRKSYYDTGFITAIQTLGIANATIRVDKKILTDHLRRYATVQVENQFLQHWRTASSLFQRLSLIPKAEFLANFSILTAKK